MLVYNSLLYRESVEKIAKDIDFSHKSVLVTGSTGLIGSCIIDVLLCANIKYDKYNTVYALGRSKEKLLSRFSYYCGDDLRYIIQGVEIPLNIPDSIDYIIHGASNADPRMYAIYPAETLLTNIYGTANVLDYCKEHTNCRMILLSTFEVYGFIDEKNEHKEDNYGLIDYNLVRSCYPESKRCAEILVRCYCEEKGVDALIARLSSVYGPTMSEKDNKAHAQFIKNGINGEKIILKSKGEQRRSYTYLFDAVSGILHLLVYGKTSQAYNISNRESVVTIADVAKTIAEICNTRVAFDVPSEIERKGFSVPQNCVLVPEKIESIGWKAKYNLRAGLQETVNILTELKC